MIAADCFPKVITFEDQEFNVDYKFCADMAALAEICCNFTTSSTHCCPCCFWRRRDTQLTSRERDLSKAEVLGRYADLLVAAYRDARLKVCLVGHGVAFS